MLQHLTGKKILYIGTAYFQYNQYIIRELAKKGATVDYFNDDPFDRLHLKNLRHRFPAGIRQRINQKYRQSILNKIKNKTYDYFLVIRGDCIDEGFMSQFSFMNPQCHKIMYQWDSIKNHYYIELIPHFHRTITFDRQDHIQLGVEYLPLFALEEFYAVRTQRKIIKQDIDILFVGYNHSTRILMMRKLKDHFAGSDLNIQSHIYTSRFSYWKNILKPHPPYQKNEVTTTSLTKVKLLELLARTRIVADMQSATQKGLTMRTFESLAAGCHLLTTNREILKEEFYDPQYISILDLDNIELPLFEKNSFIPFSEYSLSSWIDKIFKK